MPNVRVVIGLTNGETKTTDSVDASTKQIEQIKDLFRHWRTLDYVGMTINDSEYFYNPANILWAHVLVSP